MWMEDDRKVNRYSAVINWNEGRGSGGGGWTRVCVREMRVGEGGELAFILLFPFISCLYLYLLLLCQKFSPCLLFVSLFLHLCLYLFLTLSLCPFPSLTILSSSLSHACLLTSQLFPISLFFCPILSHCLLSFPLGITLFLCYEC